MKRVGQHRMPIAITPIHRHTDHRTHRFDQSSILIVDGTAAIEMVVMFRNFQHAFAGNVAAAQDILEERNHVFAFFGAAERQDEQRVV